VTDDTVSFIYGDDYGEIDTEVLGSMNGTITRRMDIPRRLAVDLYNELAGELDEATDKWIVYGTEGSHIANVAIVEAGSQQEAIEKAKDYAWMGTRPTAKQVKETPEHGGVWAAVI